MDILNHRPHDGTGKSVGFSKRCEALSQGQTFARSNGKSFLAFTCGCKVSLVTTGSATRTLSRRNQRQPGDAFLQNMNIGDWLIILVAALLLFGVKRLTDLANRSINRSMSSNEVLPIPRVRLKNQQTMRRNLRRINKKSRLHLVPCVKQEQLI